MVSSLSGYAPRRSTEGVSYDDAELEQLDMLDSCCGPCAAESPLAVSNCHMLKFLAPFGPVQGRKEESLAPRASRKGPVVSQELPGSMSNLTALRSDSSSSLMGSRRTSLMLQSEPKLPVISESKPQGMSNCVHSAVNTLC